MATQLFTITGSWKKVSNGNCLIQCIGDSDNFAIDFGATEPSDAFFYFPLLMPRLLDFGEPVWVRLSNANIGETKKIVVRERG